MCITVVFITTSLQYPTELTGYHRRYSQETIKGWWLKWEKLEIKLSKESTSIEKNPKFLTIHNHSLKKNSNKMCP
jgi:hypothetical protein